MQVLKMGTTYRIYDSSMTASDTLPANVYRINFSPMSGYSLVETDPIVINEKVYGVHTEKAEKVFTSFRAFSRNLGVILSGGKGIGKSLFAKMLAIKAVNNGYPVILCDTPYPNIAEFLGSIQQQIVILFDEFDKTFEITEEEDPQTDLLGLFDGVYMGKKLFIITCNDLTRLNNYLVNRPGRFHYHFRFGYPNEQEIEEYLRDKVSASYWDEIPSVVDFSHRIDLNYDCLRAIAFELNMGNSFSGAIQDLNIINIDPVFYDLTAVFKNGELFKATGVELDLFSPNVEQWNWFYGDNGRVARIVFNIDNLSYDTSRGCMIVNGSDVKLNNFKDGIMTEEEIKKLEKIGIDYLMICRTSDKSLHYETNKPLLIF